MSCHKCPSHIATVKELADTGIQHFWEQKNTPILKPSVGIPLKDFKAFKVQTGLVYTEVMRITATRAQLLTLSICRVRGSSELEGVLTRSTT